MVHEPASLEAQVVEPVSIENVPINVVDNPRVIALPKADRRQNTENARSGALGSDPTEMRSLVRSRLEKDTTCAFTAARVSRPCTCWVLFTDCPDRITGGSPSVAQASYRRRDMMVSASSVPEKVSIRLHRVVKTSYPSSRSREACRKHVSFVRGARGM